MKSSYSPSQQKTFLRKELREKLRQLGPPERGRRSQEILARLFSHPRFSDARLILTYLALASEVETRPIVDEARRKGKKVYVPRVDREEKRIRVIEIISTRELQSGSYGILEPPFHPQRIGEAKDLDLVIVPGLGFDREGGRLGRGEGYFDRFLQEAKRAYKIGLAFECQIVERIPREANDVKVDEVLTG